MMRSFAARNVRQGRALVAQAGKAIGSVRPGKAAWRFSLPATAGALIACAPVPVLAETAAAAAPAVSPLLATILNWGPVIAVQVFFLSPMLDVQRWQKDGTTGENPPLPYFTIPGNGFLWLVYGYLSDMNMTIMAANAPGLVLGIYYAMNFYKYRSPSADITLPLIVCGASFLVTIACALGLPVDQAKDFIGLFGCAVVVAMFSGPVGVIGKVLKTGDTSSLSLTLTVAALVNCALWFGFGSIMQNDPYIYGPNGIGLAIQMAGLAMFARFGFPKPKVV